MLQCPPHGIVVRSRVRAGLGRRDGVYCMLCPGLAQYSKRGHVHCKSVSVPGIMFQNVVAEAMHVTMTMHKSSVPLKIKLGNLSVDPVWDAR